MLSKKLAAKMRKTTCTVWEAIITIINKA